jgi:nitrogen regulatory protein PII
MAVDAVVDEIVKVLLEHAHTGITGDGHAGASLM